jgi:predicted O-methyltransferase YrrM
MIGKLLPNSIKKLILSPVWKAQRKVREYSKKKHRDAWLEEERTVPRKDLQAKHLSNTKLLTNRQELLELMPKNGVVAEIGVAAGDFSERILAATSPAKLHLVDVWASERYNKELGLSVERKFEEKINQGQIEINLGLSTEAVDSFKENYFDWIYIDTDHSYNTTKEELERYSPKVKPGGIMAGHDFIIGNWTSLTRYGVIEAVYEFCVDHDWELIYLTMGINEFPSFAIRKI